MRVKQTVLQKSCVELQHIIQYLILNGVANIYMYQVKDSSFQTNFLYVVCSWEFSCAHQGQGEADVKRHIDQNAQRQSFVTATLTYS